MKHSPILSEVLFSALLVAAGSAHAQQPPDVVQSDGRSNTAMGTGAMAQAPRDTADNTAVGFNALNAGPGGGACCGGNTAVGSSALFSDTSGSGNTGVGLAVLSSNETGSANSAIGNSALYFNTVGAFNTASGNWALRFNELKQEQKQIATQAQLQDLKQQLQAALGALRSKEQILAQR